VPRVQMMAKKKMFSIREFFLPGRKLSLRICCMSQLRAARSASEKPCE
jgi:hypothetical protein